MRNNGAPKNLGPIHFCTQTRLEWAREYFALTIYVYCMITLRLYIYWFSKPPRTIYQFIWRHLRVLQGKNSLLSAKAGDATLGLLFFVNELVDRLVGETQDAFSMFTDRGPLLL